MDLLAANQHNDPFPGPKIYVTGLKGAEINQGVYLLKVGENELHGGSKTIWNDNLMRGGYKNNECTFMRPACVKLPGHQNTCTICTP